MGNLEDELGSNVGVILPISINGSIDIVITVDND